MCAMRACQIALALFTSLFVATLVAGCGDDNNAKVSCSDDSGCLTKAGTLFVGDSGVDTLPKCCGGICMLPAGGCDSGFRYLTAEPAYGACAVMPGCPAAPPDMAMMGGPGADLASSSHD
jgi:hypothetical protein